MPPLISADSTQKLIELEKNFILNNPPGTRYVLIDTKRRLWDLEVPAQKPSEGKEE